MSEKKKYDSTVARIAGNVASGLVRKEDPRIMSALADGNSIASWVQSISMLSVGVARAIVAEVQRTEQEPKP